MIISLHPWDQPASKTRAQFTGVTIISIDDSYADDDANLPWDIIGFDSELVTEGRWRYCLHTDAVEYYFEADWPTVDTQALLSSQPPPWRSVYDCVESHFMIIDYPTSSPLRGGGARVGKSQTP